MYQVLFYKDERGREPVVLFLQTLSWKSRKKVQAWIHLLENEGPELRRPYADKVDGKLYELRIRLGPDEIRILYFFFLKDKIILLHGFRKKQRAIESRDLQVAQHRMLDVIQRYQEEQIQ